jgi:hypothetical protein
MILPSPPAISFPLVRTTTIGQSVYPEIALHISNYYIIIGTDLTDNRIYDEFEDTEGVTIVFIALKTKISHIQYKCIGIFNQDH